MLYFAKVILFIASITTLATHVNSTDNLLNAISRHDAKMAHHAIHNGADVNFYIPACDNNLATIDWNPLMRSLAHLNSSIIISQSYINTVETLSKYLFMGATTIAGFTSAYKNSWTPLALTAGITSLPYLLGRSIIKTSNAPAINNQYDIAQELLKNGADTT